MIPQISDKIIDKIANTISGGNFETIRVSASQFIEILDREFLSKNQDPAYHDEVFSVIKGKIMLDTLIDSPDGNYRLLHKWKRNGNIWIYDRANNKGYKYKPYFVSIIRSKVKRKISEYNSAIAVKGNTDNPPVDSNDSEATFCIYCGAMLKKNAVFCAECGKKVFIESDYVRNKADNNNANGESIYYDSNTSEAEEAFKETANAYREQYPGQNKTSETVKDNNINVEGSQKGKSKKIKTIAVSVAIALAVIMVCLVIKDTSKSDASIQSSTVSDISIKDGMYVTYDQVANYQDKMEFLSDSPLVIHGMILSADKDMMAIDEFLLDLVSNEWYRSGHTIYVINHDDDAELDPDKEITAIGLYNSYYSESDVPVFDIYDIFNDEYGNIIKTMQEFASADQSESGISFVSKAPMAETEIEEPVETTDQAAKLEEKGVINNSEADANVSINQDNGKIFVGSWYGNFCNKCSMLIEESDLPGHYRISISWADNGRAWTEWDLDALYTMTSYGESLVYKNGKCFYVEGIEDEDDLKRTEVYSDGSGTFYLNDDFCLFWIDEKEGTFDDDYFLQPEYGNITVLFSVVMDGPDGSVSLRAAPSTESEIYYTVPNGESIEIIEELTDKGTGNIWYKTIYDGWDCWVPESQVQVID